MESSFVLWFWKRIRKTVLAGQTLGPPEFAEVGLLNGPQAIVHHVDVSKVCGWRRGHHHVLGRCQGVSMKRTESTGFLWETELTASPPGETDIFIRAKSIDRTVGCQ
jgi:hypothetical protein